MYKLVLPLSALALLLCLLLGYSVNKVDKAINAKIAEVQAFLDENKGVVKISSAVWTRDKGWEYKVSGFLGGKEFVAFPAPNTSPNPGDFWKGRASYNGVVLTEKTKCP